MYAFSVWGVHVAFSRAMVSWNARAYITAHGKKKAMKAGINVSLVELSLEAAWMVIAGIQQL